MPAILSWALTLAVLVVVPVTTFVSAPAAQAATTSTLELAVVSARAEAHAPGGPVTAGQAITDFKFLINIDNTGTTQQRSPDDGCSPDSAGYPGSCHWASISESPHASPIYTHGTAADLAGGLDLPDGRYLISVLADGYKIDGEHFTVPLPAGTPNVTVRMQPDPLPDATARAQVFLDNAVTNGTLDQGEPGLEGFVGHLNDTLGSISTDVYGNPLCTTYKYEDPVTHEIPFNRLDADGVPYVDVVGGECLSDADGLLTIPHLGSNRYTMFVTPPDGSVQKYVQTTTLEGNHDFDTWLMEGATGYDTEFALAGEAVPQPVFGFAPETKNGKPLNAAATGAIKGTVVAINSYIPAKGGTFNYWQGMTGTKVKRPIDTPWLALADLQANDQAVWVGQGNADGTFRIDGVPDGDYSLSWWDEPQDHFINATNVSVVGGKVVSMGQLPINGWWTEYSGYVYNDKNRNGVKDDGENGIPNFTLTMRKKENALMDRGQNAAVTDANGYYFFEAAYPLNEWLVMEAYSDSFYTTGVTYQADNQPTPTTVKGSGVDVSVLNVIGLGGRMDWGVHAYAPAGNGNVDPRNGGIVGSISYDTTRNELDPRYAAVEDWQPGISDIPVSLYATVDCGTHAGVPCDANDTYEIDPSTGAYAKGLLLNEGTSETWERPTGCTARDVDGNPLVHGVDEDVLVKNQETTGECLAAPMQGVQFGPYPTDQGTPDAGFGAAVDGNYGFGDYCVGGLDPATLQCTSGNYQPLDAGGYLVSLEIPKDASGDPMYQVTREEDINIARGDQFVPQVPPPACAGALHTVDVAGILPDGPDAVDNPTFADIGASPFEGQRRPLCDTKLVELNQGKSVAPLFNLFTDVPIPSHLRGLIVDDINFATDPRKLGYGEVDGIQFAPIGVYDYTNRLVTTIESDFNGAYDVLLPSTDHISCPTPSGVCANMYRFVANDPGVPGRLNPNWNPRYRSISTEFEAMPGLIIPTDLAPTQVGVNLQIPSTGLYSGVSCPQSGTTPQLLAVSKPYVNGSGSFSIEGLGFGAHGAGSQVTLDGTIALTTSAADWTDTHIGVTVPAGVAPGAHQLEITGANGQTTVNGLTFHVLGTGYNPTVLEVGAGHPYATIQAALDVARDNRKDNLVVVYPGTPDLANPRNNPRGAYYENLIMASPVKLQGVGPGGFRGTEFVPGSIIDGSAFGGDTQLATDWYTLLDSLTWDGNQFVNDGEVVYVLASQNATNAANTARQFTSSFKASIDGFDIRGGDQQGLPPNLNELNNNQPNNLPPNITTQGGAVYANAYARDLRVTNNVVQNNGGAYGTIRIGTPDLTGADTNQHNENVTISDNRIISNAGTNLAGGIGLFAGSDSYQVSGNDICGNFSLEYGGGLTVYGRSPGGRIQHNRIYFNNSNDEGGGIMIAGQIPADPAQVSPGTGSVDIHANQIQGNLGNDDGGGIRFLMAGTAAMDVRDNIIVNNVSTHEGGGISLSDTTNVRIQGNTVMNNLTTATAVTSDGFPAPAGLSTSLNSDLLQNSLAPGSKNFSDPVLFNNIFWDNRAGSRAGTTVTGLGLTGDTSPIDLWDIGSQDAAGKLSPTASVIAQAPGGAHPYNGDPSNSAADPAVVQEYDASVSFATWRQNAAFVDATLVALEAPANELGDYHLTSASPAINLGAGSKAGVAASNRDFDAQIRPYDGGWDAGADEFGSIAPPPPPPVDLYFSTTGNVNPPGVSGTADDADIYRVQGAAVTRAIDLSASPYSVPASGNGNANTDAFSRVDADHFYASFTGNVTLPGNLQVQDGDLVYWNADHWELYFDASRHGLGTNVDLGAMAVSGTTLYFSTGSNGYVPPGAGGTGDDADVYRWEGGNLYTRVVDASAAAFSLPGGAALDGLAVVDATHFYASFSATTTTVPGLGDVQDEDVVLYDAGTWELYFDGTAAGFTDDRLDLDAISLSSGALPATPAPPVPPLYYSTAGAAAPTGLGLIGDNSDVYLWNGTAHTRVNDLSAAPYNIPNGLFNNPNVDGLSRVDDNHFYVSFDASVSVPGIGTVQDEDVVYWNGANWQMWFDGSVRGVTANLDAISVVGTTLYFSLDSSTTPPGAVGSGDDADVYRWNGGTSYTRVVDASAAPYGMPSSANVDGLIYVDPTHFYISLAGSTSGFGLGSLDAEDVAYFNTSSWSLFFDGTAVDLGDLNRQPDAISFDTGASPAVAAAPAQQLLFSTLGGARPPGVSGPAGAGAIYAWDGTGYSLAVVPGGPRSFQLPQGANVDGFSQAGAGTFFVSFTDTVHLRKVGQVQAGDVVLWNGRGWKMWFDASSHHLGNRFSVGATSVRQGRLYFSLRNRALPRGVRTSGDPADIYRWTGRQRYTRVFDASEAGLKHSARVDGMAFVDEDLVYVSFANPSTRVPGVGVVQDEDVLAYRDGSWSVVFDGTSYGLGGSSGLDVDAFDVP